MIVQTQQSIKLHGQRVGVLKVYLEGSGDPNDNHSVIGFSIDGQGQGTLPDAKDIGKFEKVEEIILVGAF